MTTLLINGQLKAMNSLRELRKKPCKHGFGDSCLPRNKHFLLATECSKDTSLKKLWNAISAFKNLQNISKFITPKTRIKQYFHENSFQFVIRTERAQQHSPRWRVKSVPSIFMPHKRFIKLIITLLVRHRRVVDKLPNSRTRY